ncbi:MAG: hypothetical protein AAE983_05445 [Thermoplasmataceae archaeon]|jgi:hypothetical protein
MDIRQFHCTDDALQNLFNAEISWYAEEIFPEGCNGSHGKDKHAEDRGAVEDIRDTKEIER